MRSFALQARGAIQTPLTRQIIPATRVQYLNKTSHAYTSVRMSSSAGELKIENTNIKTAPGVELSESQKTIVGSVLDLFAGRPSLAKLQLWKDDAEFLDPITISKGRDKYQAQWYGLQAAFSEIERLHHEVKSAGNPISLDMKTRYVIKGINKEQTIASQVNIYTDGDKITKVEDKWDGKLPESSFADVSSPLQLLSPFWWWRYGEGWAFWMWSFVWETSIWRVRRCAIDPMLLFEAICEGVRDIMLIVSSSRFSVSSTHTPCRLPSAFQRMLRRMLSVATNKYDFMSQSYDSSLYQYISHLQSKYISGSVKIRGQVLSY